MRDVLLGLSGADRALLLSEAPRDRVKYEGIGSAVLLTAGMAAVSSGIALRMALDLSLVVAVAAGLLWGLGMLSLDRWLVSANQRQDSKLLTLLLALPRVALALSVGLVMSTPLVLQVFSPEIDSRLAQEHQAAKAELERELDADPRFAALPRDREAFDQAQRGLAGGPSTEEVYQDVGVAALRQQVADSRKRLEDAEMALVCERDGSCGTAQAGSGPAYEEKRAVFTRASQELPLLEAELEAAQQQARQRLESEGSTRAAQLQQQGDALTRLQQQRDEAQHVREAAIDADKGVLARLEALHEIGAERPAMQHAHWALFVFLTFIECLPVLIKLLLSFGKPTLYEQLSTAADAEKVR